MSAAITPMGSSSQPAGQRKTKKSLHQFHFDRFVNDGANFQPQDGHRVVEIREPDSSDDAYQEEFELTEPQVAVWLRGGQVPPDARSLSPGSGGSVDANLRLKLL